MHSQLRIVSLVPSITETLVYLGHISNLVGCTHFCTQPQRGLSHIPKIGGTKNPNIEKIKNLNPTHIIMNKEENRLEDYHAFKNCAEIITTHPKSPSDVPDMLYRLSLLFPDTQPFQKLSLDIQQELSTFKESKRNEKSLYFIWKNPWMLAGPDTYIGSFLEKVHQQLYPTQSNTQYPSYQLEDLLQWDIENIFLSSEPWPFRKREMIHFKKFIDKGTKIFHINGILSSWHGISTLKGLREIKKWERQEKNTCIQKWS
ncbi:MAG: ABC transporter substrate-binding protein [Oligoflexales bacterium]